MLQRDRASSAVPSCTSLTLSPTPVQLCLPIQWRRRLPLTPSVACGTFDGPRVVRVSNALEGYTIASNALKCKAVDVKTAVGIWTGNVSCIPKLCGVPPSIANTLQTSVERYYLDFVAYNCKSGYSLNGLRYSKKEFLFGV